MADIKFDNTFLRVRFKEIRNNCGLSLNNIADDTDNDYRQISLMETGKRTFSLGVFQAG